MKSPAVLVVDDDESARTYISRFLSSQGYVVDCLASGELVMSRIDSPKPPSLLLLDVRMPNVGGLEVLAHMEETGRRVPTIVVSGVDQVGIAVKAMKMGASDYLLKPFDEEELELAVRHALEDPADTAVAEPSPEPFDDSPAPDFTSANAKMRRVKETARRVAGADVPVLILGESGVGKEVLAKYIHAVSPRCHHPFVKVNCAALPAELMESELFGYDRGAFTGAWREKQGKFE